MSREPYKLLDLFSGIGGFSLGLERTGGFKTVAFCEINPFCRKVLKKHWPEVPQYDDVRTLTAERLAADGVAVDAICGGFPCQDISTAGKGAGIEGERSGLWSEYARIIGELRPRYVIVENVSALLGRGLDRVLGDLASLGYDAEWHCISASAVGAPHRRDRIWILANAKGLHCDGGDIHDGRDSESHRTRSAVRKSRGSREIAADALFQGLAGRLASSGVSPKITAVGCYSWWACEPNVGRVAYGVPSRVDRLGSLGNAVVPQIPELIGRAILASEHGGNP